MNTWTQMSSSSVFITVWMLSTYIFISLLWDQDELLVQFYKWDEVSGYIITVLLPMHIPLHRHCKYSSLQNNGSTISTLIIVSCSFLLCFTFSLCSVDLALLFFYFNKEAILSLWQEGIGVDLVFPLSFPYPSRFLNQYPSHWKQIEEMASPRVISSTAFWFLHFCSLSVLNWQKHNLHWFHAGKLLSFTFYRDKYINKERGRERERD